ncbi:MAG: RIP metalloprotease RseP [Chloroflexia bacterium]
MNWYWLWIIPVLGSLVFIHELGHFVTARVLGIRVEEFAIGFPPRLFSVKRNGIEYSLNALPIGGYVRILGENGESDAPDSFSTQPAWKRIIVLAAGSSMNLLLALALFIALGIGGEQVADNSPVGFQSILAKNPAQVAGLQPGDILAAVNGRPIDNTDAAFNALNNNLGQTVTLTIKRGAQTMQVPVKLNPQGPALGVSLQASYSPIRISSVSSGSDAAVAGLQPGDVIKKVNGKDISSTLDAGIALAAVNNGAVTLTVDRGGASKDLQATVKGGNISGYAYKIPTHTATYSIGEAIGRGFSQTGDLIRRVLDGLIGLIVNLFSGHTEGVQVSGPVGIAQLTGEVVQDSGLSGLLRLTALLGINLGLINLFPLPALDGGRLLFILVELLRGGRKIAPEKEGLVHAIGMAALLLLMLIIAYSDVQNLGHKLLP